MTSLTLARAELSSIFDLVQIFDVACFNWPGFAAVYFCRHLPHIILNIVVTKEQFKNRMFLIKIIYPFINFSNY